MIRATIVLVICLFAVVAVAGTASDSAPAPLQKGLQDTVQPFLTVRVAVLNNTLEEAFRTWHASFRPLKLQTASCAA